MRRGPAPALLGQRPRRVPERATGREQPGEAFGTSGLQGTRDNGSCKPARFCT